MSRALDRRALLEVVRRRRALLGAGLVAAAVATALPQLAPAPAPAVRVLAAAHDLAPGVPLTAADLTLVSLPRAAAPSDVLTSEGAALGRQVSGAVRRGEALTDVRLLGAGLLAPGSGLVAAPVRLADPATAALLRVGDLVDVLAAPTAPGAADAAAGTVAAQVRVLAVPTTQDQDPDGALVVLAASPGVAARLAAAAVSSRLSVTVLPG